MKTRLSSLGRIVFCLFVATAALALSEIRLRAQGLNQEEGGQAGVRIERPQRGERGDRPPPRAGGPRGPRRAPPPRATDGSREAGPPMYTVAPDGIGVTMREGASPLPYTKNTVTYIPWEEGSKLEPLKVGSELPSGSVAYTKTGAKVDLNKLVMKKPTVLIYYRGGWCPFCNVHLQELQESVPALEEMGYQLLAVSTDTVEALKAYDDSELEYQLLADPDLTLATNLGVKYKVVQRYIQHVKEIPHGRAFDLEERNGGHLITPGAFVLNTKGTIHFSYSNDNYTVRASREALLKAAKAALEK